jgi:hypothetical protein
MEGMQDGTLQRITLDPPIPWSSQGGVFLSDDYAQWYYETSPESKKIAGLSRVQLYKSEGVIVRMNGLFSTLYDPKVTWGQVEFQIAP